MTQIASLSQFREDVFLFFFEKTTLPLITSRNSFFSYVGDTMVIIVQRNTLANMTSHQNTLILSNTSSSVHMNTNLTLHKL